MFNLGLIQSCKFLMMCTKRELTAGIIYNDFVSVYFRGFTKFCIKVAWSLQFLGYLRTLSLKFQKARTKIEVVLSLPWWLPQLN